MPTAFANVEALQSAESRPAFARVLGEHHAAPLIRSQVNTLQLNVGKLCNMACHHCHVEAGPKRTEMMNERVVARVLELLAAAPDVQLLDLTGGAPELNPHFRHLVREARALGKRVIDRCNLTVFYEPEQADTPEFLAQQGVEVVASLPCYSAANVEEQRGRGAFDKSIEGLRRLNALGYGRAGTGLKLDLVYNPVGPALPPSQVDLEASYKHELRTLFGIEFDALLTITNMPIKRFAHVLERGNAIESYMDLLVQNFNPGTVEGLMCRSLLSVSWDGRLYDCDFNQMLEMPLGAGRPSIWDIDSLADIDHGPVSTADHCFACTAGAGSSCSGALK